MNKYLHKFTSLTVQHRLDLFENDFVYGGLGRMNCQYVRYFTIINYWVKLLHANDNKYVKKVYNMLKYDSESNPDKKKWCSLLYGLLRTLGLTDAWLFQDIGDSVLV